MRGGWRDDLAQNWIEFEATAQDQRNDEQDRKQTGGDFHDTAQALCGRWQQQIYGHGHDGQDDEGQSRFGHGCSLETVSRCWVRESVGI